MKKALLLALVLILYPTTQIGAQEVINAGILPTVWYSNTTIYAGDEIKIYGGMQNHSTSTIQAQAVFLIDGEPVSTAKFTSKPDTLMEIEGKWVATSGNHKISLRITSAEPDNLLSKTSDEMSLSVKTPITTAKVKEVASETAETIVSNIDDATETLANKILELKKPTAQTEPQTLSGQPTNGEKLQATDATDTASNATRSAYNLALTFLASSILHWKITLGALVLLVLIMKFTS